MFARRNRSLLKSRTRRTRRLLSELLEDRRLLAANPLSSIPLLNSYPEASASLYLDFDGHYEETWGSHSNISTPAYDTDGDSTSFSDGELVAIEEIWQVVSEDFAPFNINVTTVEPSVLAPGVPAAAADGVALRVAIGGVPDGGNGGLAYINAFTNYIPNVAYVRGSSSAAKAGSVVSHEAGHSFGLAHVALSEPLDLSWQRLMNTVMFSDGASWSLAPTSADASVIQDDISILAGATNGFGLRSDDHSDFFAEATPLTQIDSPWIGSGQVGTDTDVDVFAFTVSTANTYSIRSMAAAIGPNLDAVIELYNSANALIAVQDPQDSQHAEVRLNLNPGDYYVAVRSTGEYGRIGQYDVVIEKLVGGIKVTPASTTMTTGEDGRQTSFTVVLESQPTSDVTIPVSSTDIGLGTVSASALVFNATNWSVPQVVTVTGLDNFNLGEDIAYGVTIGAAVSEDPAFDSTDPADLQIVSVDNDASGFLYRVDPTTDQIVRSGLSGSPVQTIVDIPAVFGSETSYTPRTISVDYVEGKLYWVDSATRSIYRSSLDGSNSETVASFSSGSLTGVAVDPNARKMYWGDSLNSTRKIFRANLDGSQVEVVVADTSPSRVALDIAAGKLYWTDSAAASIRRANLDGSAVETVWSGDSGASALALEPLAGKMYWSTSGAEAAIHRSNLDGTDVEVVVDTARYSQFSIRGITVDAASEKLYWADWSTQGLYRSDLNGTLVAQLGDAVAVYGMGLAVVHPAPAITVSGQSELVTREDGSVATFQVSLETPPSGAVTIPVSVADATEGSVSVASLTFTATNWNAPQTVVVTGVDDFDMDGDIRHSILLGAATSSDVDYDGRDPQDVSVTNMDDDQPVLVFSDSFEGGAWSGKWVEDYQNDWFRSSQRSADGFYAAEVDGSANNATLTMAQAVDLTPYGTVELSFSWYIEGSLDSGEYLALDLYDGTSWQEVTRLRGNADQENVWHHETLDIAADHLVSDFQLRFRAKMNGSTEDANVDDVRLVATSLAGPPNQTPVAVGDSGAGLEDAPIAINVLANDSDPDSDPLVVAAVTHGTHGQVVANSNGTITYTPDSNFHGSDSFTYSIDDGRGGTDTATVDVNVASLNDSPMAQNDVASADIGASVVIDVLANDSDADGDSITLQSLTQGGHGTVIDNGNGTLTYTPAAEYTGDDSFTYTISDGHGGTEMATVAITILPAEMIAFSDSFETGEWNGQWVGNSQNDWFRSSQRATDGGFSAEVDGSASNATLTMAEGIDLADYDTATLTFSWLIESAFDRREYIALDIYDGVWHQNIRTLQGNADQENVWHHETVDLSGYLSNDVKIRFRANVSSSSEDANVDNIQIVASQTAMSALLASPEMATAMMLDATAPASAVETVEDGGRLGPSSEAGTRDNNTRLDTPSVFAAGAKTNRGHRHSHASAMDAVMNERRIGFLSDELLGLLSDRGDVGLRRSDR